MTRPAVIVSVVLFTTIGRLQAQTDTPSTTSEITTETKVVKEVKQPATLPYRPAGEPVLRLLRKRVESVDWNEAPFEEVVEWLKDESDGQVNVLPRLTALQVENVTLETPITLQMRNTTVADVMEEVLNQLSEDGQVRYHGGDNTIKISSRSDFDRFLYVRVYDATDILFRVPNFGQGAPQIDLQQSKGGGQGGGGGGQSVFSGGSSGGGSDQQDSGQQGEQRLQQELERIRNQIKIVIAPESWREIQGAAGAGGGGRGEIEVIKNSLVVSNTIEVHEQIAGHFVRR